MNFSAFQTLPVRTAAQSGVTQTLSETLNETLSGVCPRIAHPLRILAPIYSISPRLACWRSPDWDSPRGPHQSADRRSPPFVPYLYSLSTQRQLSKSFSAAQIWASRCCVSKRFRTLLITVCYVPSSTMRQCRRPNAIYKSIDFMQRIKVLNSFILFSLVFPMRRIALRISSRDLFAQVSRPGRTLGSRKVLELFKMRSSQWEPVH